MKRIMACGFLAGFFFLHSFAFAGDDCPRCSDETVTGLVKQLVVGPVKDYMVPEAFKKLTMGIPQYQQSVYPTYQQCLDARSKDLVAMEVVKYVEKEMDGAKMTVDGVRTVDKSPKTHQCRCVAQLKLESPETNRERTYAVGYAAQYTDDLSQVYVTLLGLK